MGMFRVKFMDFGHEGVVGGDEYRLVAGVGTFGWLEARVSSFRFYPLEDGFNEGLRVSTVLQMIADFGESCLECFFIRANTSDA